MTGIKFDVQQFDIDELVRDANITLAKGDKSAVFSYYHQMMFGKDYGGEFRDQAWNQVLGLNPIQEKELKDLIKTLAKRLEVSLVE